MAVFSTDLAKEYPMTTKNTTSGMGRKSFSFQLLPILSHKKIKKSKSISTTEMIEMRQDLELESDKAMLSDNFTSSSDDDQESGTVNASFHSETNNYATPYKTFGYHKSAGGNLKDGSDIHYLDNGKCVVADLLGSRLMIFSKSGRTNLTLQNSDIVEPWGITVHEDIILVTCRRTKCICKLMQTGETEEASFGTDFLLDPCGIAVTKAHNIVVSDIQKKSVTVHDWSGNLLYELGVPNNFSLPRYITVSPLGDIIVSDSGRHCVFLFSEDGVFKKQFGSYGSADHQLKAPYGVCCDRFGNIFVADHYNDRISFFSKDGDFIRNVITKHDGIFHPQGISLSSDMKLYITHGSLKAQKVKVFTLKSEHTVFDDNMRISNL